jgi:drug/metabolite transporter (DMT)-like permease
MNVEAALLALIAAAGFGLALVVTQFGLRHISAANGPRVSIPLTMALFWILSPICFDPSGWQPSAGAIFAGVGLFFPAVVTMITYEANQRMGPTVAGTIAGTAPVFATAGAALFLGERVTAVAGVATVAIIAGIVILSWRRKAHARWPAWVLLLPLAAALLNGLAQVTTKQGLAIWPSAFSAGLIGYSMSAVSVTAVAWLRGARRFELNRTGVLWFALVGLCNGSAVLSMYAALAIGAVTFVAPTVATYPLFTLLFGRLLLRGEPLTLRAFAGTALCVAGVGGLLLGQ